MRIDDFCQLRHARVGYFDDADVGFDGAEGIVRRFDARLGQRVKEGRFADVGQADDAAFQAHVFPEFSKENLTRDCSINRAFQAV